MTDREAQMRADQAALKRRYDEAGSWANMPARKRTDHYCPRCFELIRPDQDTMKLNGYLFHASCLEDLQRSEYEGLEG